MDKEGARKLQFKESQLKQYAEPLSDTEDAKCKRAIEAIRDALKSLGYTDDQKNIGLLESDTLSYAVSMRSNSSPAKIHIFIQGSYANNTCVRNESDVDIAIVREDKYDYAFGEKYSEAIFSADRKTDAKILKDEVERVLKAYFPSQVHRGNKSIKVDGNTYRKKADTVPCFSMHYYYKSHIKDYLSYYDGVIIYADDGTIIRNFPKQHIANGKSKNNRTKYYYKKMVRIIKKIRYIMQDYGCASANGVSSFGLESLVWNIPDSYFTKWHCLGFAFKEIVQYLYLNKWNLPNYYEANGIKLLCPTQGDIRRYSEFIDRLYSFFEYDYGS